jgi:hypothetical protein
LGVSPVPAVKSSRATTATLARLCLTRAHPLSTRFSFS